MARKRRSGKVSLGSKSRRFSSSSSSSSGSSSSSEDESRKVVVILPRGSDSNEPRCLSIDRPGRYSCLERSNSSSQEDVSESETAYNTQQLLPHDIQQIVLGDVTGVTITQNRDDDDDDDEAEDPCLQEEVVYEEVVEEAPEDSRDYDRDMENSVDIPFSQEVTVGNGGEDSLVKVETMESSQGRVSPKVRTNLSSVEEITPLEVKVELESVKRDVGGDPDNVDTHVDMDVAPNTPVKGCDKAGGATQVGGERNVEVFDSSIKEEDVSVLSRPGNEMDMNILVTPVEVDDTQVAKETMSPEENRLNNFSGNCVNVDDVESSEIIKTIESSVKIGVTTNHIKGNEGNTTKVVLFPFQQKNYNTTDGKVFMSPERNDDNGIGDFRVLDIMDDSKGVDVEAVVNAVERVVITNLSEKDVGEEVVSEERMMNDIEVPLQVKKEGGKRFEKFVRGTECVKEVMEIASVNTDQETNLSTEKVDQECDNEIISILGERPGVKGETLLKKNARNKVLNTISSPIMEDKGKMEVEEVPSISFEEVNELKREMKDVLTLIEKEEVETPIKIEDTKKKQTAIVDRGNLKSPVKEIEKDKMNVEVLKSPVEIGRGKGVEETGTALEKGDNKRGENVVQSITEGKCPIKTKDNKNDRGSTKKKDREVVSKKEEDQKKYREGATPTLRRDEERRRGREAVAERRRGRELLRRGEDNRRKERGEIMTPTRREESRRRDRESFVTFSKKGGDEKDREPATTPLKKEEAKKRESSPPLLQVDPRLARAQAKLEKLDREEKTAVTERKEPATVPLADIPVPGAKAECPPPPVLRSDVIEGAKPIDNNHSSNSLFDADKPVKVKSRWRRSSELEMGNSNSVPPTILSNDNIINKFDCATVTTIVPAATQVSSLPGVKCPEMEARIKSFQPITINEFLTERSRSKEAKRMVCDCSLSKEEIARGEMGCGEDCLNRLLMIECGSRCSLGNLCSNKRFQSCTYTKCEVIKTLKKGLGLKCLENVPSGHFLMEYVGEVIEPKEFKRRAKEYAKDKNRHYYFMALKADTIIDATHKGNISRFINHSCQPNAETQKWTVNGELRIGFFSKRAIRIGDEITFDYQLQRYGKEAQRCYCESTNCRGWIGEDPEKEKDKKDWRKERKEKKRKEEKRRDFKEYLNDMDLEEEIEKLYSVGVKNQAHTLTLCRLMVRAEEHSCRSRLLDIARKGDTRCLRLFLDYHGLALLWSWMMDNTSPNKLKIQILDTLFALPIQNKTMLKDSKVMCIVEKWTKPRGDVMSINDRKDRSSTEDENSGSPDGDIVMSNSKPGPTDKDQKDVKLTASPGAADNRPLKEDERLIIEKSKKLVQKWSVLKEEFRIPKKQRIEQMKEHEREADMAYNTDPRESQSYDRHRSYDKDGSRYRDKDSIRKKRESPDVDWASKKMRTDDRNAPNSMSRMAKAQRRQLFAMKVEEEERQRKQMEEMWQKHQEQCMALGVDPTQTAVFNPQTGYPAYYHPANGTWNPYPQQHPDGVMGCDGMDGKQMGPPPGGPMFPPTNQPPPGVMPVGNWGAPPSFGMPPYMEPPQPYPPPGGPPPPFMEGYPPQQPYVDQSMFQPPPQAGGVYCPPPGYPPGPVGYPPQQSAGPVYAPFNPPPPQPQQPPPPLPHQIPMPPMTPTIQTQPLPQPMQPPTPQLQLQPQVMDVPPVHQIPMPQQQPTTPTVAVTHESVVSVPPLPHYPPPPPLPARWKAAKDKEGRTYYYHTKTRKSQWQFPVLDPNDVSETSSESDDSSDIDDTSSDDEEEKQTQEEEDEEEAEEEMTNETNAVVGIPALANEDLKLKDSQKGKDSVTSALINLGGSGSSGRTGKTGTDDIGASTTPVNTTLVQEVQEPVLKKRREGLVQVAIISPRDDSYYKGISKAKIRDAKEKLLRQKMKMKARARKRNSSSSTSRDGSSGIGGEGGSAKCEADTSSGPKRRIKDMFRINMANVVVANLNAYRKHDCKVARITSTEDFKHLARKLTHFVMVKELRHCINVEDLECNDNVKHKARDFIKKYMSKFGPVYKRPLED